MATDSDRGISAIAALDQPLRRDVYRLLAEPGTWIGRDEAADALGVPRSVAAFHLDKLVDAGLAEARFERRTGRTGPGAGRPSKLYRRSTDEASASVPERHYDLAGELMVRAIAESVRTGSPVDEQLAEVARAAGREAGVEVAAKAAAEADPADAEARRVAVLDALGSHGYEPVRRDDGEIVLRNCPFHRLAEEERPLVCGMNLDYLEGCLDGVGAAGELTARLAPEPGYCCVRLSERSASND